MKLLHVTEHPSGGAGGQARREVFSWEMDLGALERLRPLLMEAARLNAEHPGSHAVELSGTGWHVMAARESGALLRLALWRGGLPAGRPHVTGKLKTAGGEAVLSVDASGLARIRLASERMEAAREARELERGLAWAWLTRERVH